MGAKLGLDCKLYRNTGSYGSPTWTEITKTKNVTLNVEKGEADVSTRGSAGWRERKGTLKDASIEFELIHDTGALPLADFVALRDAFLNNTSIEVLALDGSSATSGEQGLRATVDVMKFTRKEQLEEAVAYDVTLKPTPNDNSAPAWYTVS